MLQNVSNVTVYKCLTNDCWIRDYGPTFVHRNLDGKVVGVDWRFNAWGGKYPPYEDDARAAEFICRQLMSARSQSSLYCEGGALETDGEATLLSTSSCLMSRYRNPGWTRDMVEDELKRQLGVTKVIWVDGGGLEGDDTDGHIDQLARFVSPTVVVAATSSDPMDPNRSGLEQNLDILSKKTDAAGRKLTVHALPTPAPRKVDGKRVPESYCNFLFVNGAVLVPTFGSPHTDRAALEILAQLIPDRKIIPVDCRQLIIGLGAVHCATQQEPANRANA